MLLPVFLLSFIPALIVILFINCIYINWQHNVYNKSSWYHFT